MKVVRLLGPCYTCKMKATDAQRGSNRREIVAALNTFAPYGLHVREDIEDALREAEVFDGTGQLAMFDQKSAVAGHAGQERFHWMDSVRIVEASNVDAVVNSPDKFFQTGIACLHHGM